MNWQHFRTLMWVRWRVTVNFTRRTGFFNLIITAIAATLCLLVSVTGFFVSLIAGNSYLAGTSSPVVMCIVDAWVAGLLGFWSIGVLTELQRAEMLSIDKLLHLPTTLNEIYLFNFLSQLLSFSIITFVPPMLGMSLALIGAKGLAALVMFPLLLTFVLMICAVTYQFRGWLATVMANKRRQRTILTLIGVGFMVITQLPNLIMMRMHNQSREQVQARTLRHQEARVALQTKLAAGRITPPEFMKQSDEIRVHEVAEVAEEKQARTKKIYEILEIVNLVLPIGWIASGAKAAADGNPWPGLAGAAGMGAITVLSLRRSYRTTVRYFTGNISNPQQAAVVVPSEPKHGKPGPPIPNMIEWSWPFASEPVAAIAWTTFRSLTRAPQVKMILFGPCIMLGMYVVMFFPMFKAAEGFSLFRTFMPLGVMGLSISSLAALSHNCFSFDRSGFRSYVLSGVPRRDILWGKNLALAPFVLVATIPILIVIQCLAPAPWTHFLAILLAIPTTFLAMSLLGNVSSIMTPICQPNGAMKPANLKPVAMLLQLVFGMATLLVIAIVGSLPIGMELLAQIFFGLNAFIPLGLIIAAVELTVSIWYYFLIIRWQGELLQSRECKILELITENGE